MPYKAVAKAMAVSMISNMTKAMRAYNDCIHAHDHNGAGYYMNRARYTSRMIAEAGIKHEIKYKIFENEFDTYQIFASVEFNECADLLHDLEIDKRITNRTGAVAYDFS